MDPIAEMVRLHVAAKRFLCAAEDAIAVRRWDDLAKLPERATPPLAHFISALRACLL
jgi:predicted HD phosphohydrolase